MTRRPKPRSPKPPAVVGACLCGAVRLEAARQPRQLTDCNCSRSRRYGALWLYCSTTTARVVCARGATRGFVRPNGWLRFHHCTRCGCLTHYTAARGNSRRLALNARLLDPAQLAGVRVRRLDGAKSWRVLEHAPFEQLVISSAR